MTLLPEHDIMTEIAATLRDLPVQIDFQWVKGHQDSNKSYNELDIPARLNCDADRAASLYRWPTNKSHQKIPPLPNTPSQLVINNKIITSHIKQHIRSEATEPELMEYLKKKFPWDDNTLTTIDWNSFQQVIQKYTTQRSTVVKHLHAISPTGHIAHRNNTHMPHDCPACAHPEEDNMHLLTCTHESRISWRADTIAAIACYVPETSDPYLLDFLRDGLTRMHRKLDDINPTQYPEKYHQLISQQTRIGWDHLYRGRWSTEWATSQHNYEKNKNQTAQYKNSTRWLVGLGRILIDRWLKLWQLRNEQRHGKDASRLTELHAQKLYSELHDLYSYKDRVCPNDRHIFHDSFEDHITSTSSLDTLESWIRTYKHAITASATQAQR
jgi:hypothetical protein